MKLAIFLVFTTAFTVGLPIAYGKESPRARPSRVPAATIPFETRQALDTSTQVLLDVIRPGYNQIPLAVLNKTRCVVFVNTKGAADVLGIASCRLSPNDWTGPAFVSYHDDDRAAASRNRELLVLLLSERAVESLIKGQLKLGTAPGSKPGPLVPKQAALKEEDIKEDTFTYGHAGKRTLAAADIHATVTADHEKTRGLYGGRADVERVLSGHAPAPRITASYVTAVDSFFNTITPVGIIIHHSATLPSSHRVPTNLGQVDRFHQQRGFAVACFGRLYHVAYHYFILPDGRVKAGRPENCQGAHAHGYNAYLGISLAGDFSKVDNPRGKKGPRQPTAAQMKSLQALCRRLMRRYRIPARNVLRHSDVSNTRCPGDRFPFTTFVKHLRPR